MADFTLHDLEKRVRVRARAPADTSYTRKLLDQGVAGCARKLGEEAIETVIAAVEPDRGRLIAETADLIYHLLVVLAARAVLSWFPVRPGSPLLSVVSLLADLTEPVLRPFRSIIPPVGMFDLSFMVVFFVLFIVQGIVCAL